MQITQWVDRVGEHLAALYTALGTLIDAFSAESELYAFYQEGDGSPLSAEAARAEIAQQLLALDYPDQREAVIATPERFAAVMASAATLAQVARVNQAKTQFQQVHIEIRQHFDSEADATDALRRVLALIGRPQLNLDACDRRIPCLAGAVQRLHWYRTASAPSTRKTLADAREALLKLRDTVQQERVALIDREIAALESMDLTTPVAYRARDRVQSTRYRARVIGAGEAAPVTTLTGYGMNPVFFADTPRLTPEVDTPRPRRRPGAGRPSTISDECVSFSLPHWFWYKQPPVTKTPRATAAPPRRLNPHAKTPFPGLWLGTRARKRGLAAYVMVASPDKAPTSVSIQQHGLAAAWTKAAAIYCDHHSVHLEEVVAQQPAPAQVDALLGWHREPSPA